MKKNMIGMTKRLAAGMLAAVMLISAAACGKSSKDSDKGNGGQGGVDNTVSVMTILDAVKEAYGEEYIPDVQLAGEDLQFRYGIDPAWCEEAVAETPMMSFHVDTFIAVKAKEANLKEVTDAVNAYADMMKNEMIQYPANMTKVAASTVYTKGNYVFYIMLGVLSFEEEELDEAEQTKIFEQKNQIAIDAINKLILK